MSTIAKADLSQITGPYLWALPRSAAAVTPPTNIRIVDEDADSVYLQWDPVSGADYYHFYYQEQGEESFWYDDDPAGGPMKMYYDGSGYSLYYYGLTAGHSYNVIITAVKDGVESADSQVFSFTKKDMSGGGTTSNAGKNSIGYYPDGWWCPDFGAFAGQAPTYWNNNGTSCIYYYAIESFDDVENYFSLLEADGFVFDARMSDVMSKEDEPAMSFVKFGDYDYAVTCSIDGEELVVFFLLN